MEIEPFNYSVNDAIFNIGTNEEKIGMSLEDIIKETKEKDKNKNVRKSVKAVMQPTQSEKERKRLLVQNTARRSQHFREQQMQNNRTEGDQVQRTQRLFGQINKILQNKDNQVIRTSRFVNNKTARGRRSYTVSALARQRALKQNTAKLLKVQMQRKQPAVINNNSNKGNQINKALGKEVKISFINSKAQTGFKFNNRIIILLLLLLLLAHQKISFSGEEIKVTIATTPLLLTISRLKDNPVEILVALQIISTEKT